MARIRNDLFLTLGLWHPYAYAHHVLWHEFRYTFLAPAYFALFPDSKLMRRPKLMQSSIFFSWLRLAYPGFRVKLHNAVATSQASMLQWERSRAVRVLEGKELKVQPNPFRPQYVHLLNLETLFEFCIPCIQNYGIALKLNDWQSFLKCYLDLSFLFYCCTSKGSHDYQRTMYIFSMLLPYWSQKGLPIFNLLARNHTLFSEESGEIALSVLTQAQPPSTRANLDSTRQQWQVVSLRSKLLRQQDKPKKHRIIGKLYSIYLYFPAFIYLWVSWLHVMFIYIAPFISDLCSSPRIPFSLPSDIIYIMSLVSSLMDVLDFRWR
jgi:hypothetical protein